MSYSESDYLLLSGLQHFVFCRRQWALIHVENQWADNLRTTEGHLLHERVHDTTIRERRGNIITVRGLPICSPTLGVSGQCDVVEYHRGSSGIALPGLDGLWQPYPVEYKRGAPKETNADRFQLCCQAMCLEEMLCCDIPTGSLFYGEIRRRETVFFSSELRNSVLDALREMHQIYERGHTPKVKPSKACRACSLKELCLPKLMRRMSVSTYLAAAMEEL